MNHTPQIKKAIQFAARKHHGQMRISDGQLPYVTHLFSVALLVAEDGAHDDVVTAALLHDTLEDTETTRAEIVSEFNERVAELVESVTEVKEGLDWRDYKQNYLALMGRIDEEALLIAIADKVDNVESRIEEYQRDGADFLRRWKRPMADYLWFYGEALRVAEARLPNHSLTKRLAQEHAKQIEVFTNTL